MVNMAAVLKLKLPVSVNVHLMFHVSWVKPVKESNLSPASDDPPPAPIIDGAPTCTVRGILDVYRRQCQHCLSFIFFSFSTTGGRRPRAPANEVHLLCISINGAFKACVRRVFVLVLNLSCAFDIKPFFVYWQIV